MRVSSKILHWLIFLVFLILVCTAVAANVLFSKEAIMQSFSYSLPAIDVQIPPADQLFVARLERRATWAIHFWTGMAFFTLVLLRFVLFLRRKNVHRFLNFMTFGLIALLFASGLPLFVRIYVDIPAEVQQFARSLHYVLAWGMGLFVVLHIGWVIWQENSKNPGIVSQMFRFQGRFWMMFLVTGIALLTPLHADKWQNDPDYQRAMAYMEGKIGTSTITKTIKNCPYAKCDEVADSVNRNVKSITRKTKNYPRMVAHFKKSLEKGNPLAAAKLAKFLIGRIDYRSKVPDSTLIKIGERDTGMRYKAYVALAKRALKFAADHGDCYSMYKLAEFLRKGQMGFAKSTHGARYYYQKILKTCDPKSFFVMMSQSRMRRVD